MILPVEFTNKLSLEYSKIGGKNHKKETGQYFTPPQIAKFMASLVTIDQAQLDILDPGIGTGILSSAIIQNIVENRKMVKRINLTGYEIDKNLKDNFTVKSLEHLKEFARLNNIDFQYDLKGEDFILDNDYSLHNNKENKYFDIIISNPPYFKLNSKDPRKVISDKLFNGQTNIYSLFYSFAANLLKPNGELIFISPRSFTSGNYFKTFRNYFFEKIQIERIHLFESRTETFKSENVLQETLILKGKLKEKKLLEYKLIISSSKNSQDLKTLREKSYDISEVMNLHDREKMLHLPSSSEEEKIIKLFQKWDNKLSDFGINISTGKVVSFRAEDSIKEDKSENSVPLIWLYNVAMMDFKKMNGREGKGKHIIHSSLTKSSLVENKDYVLLRRFSSKDDAKRLIACAYLGNYFHSKNLGIENKVNYIYRQNGELGKNELFGLSALLNSSLFDSYFRTFNGNVNVSATEIRSINFPDLQVINKIGENILRLNEFTQIAIDEIVNKTLKINFN